jgi:hypothetical protein
MELEILLPHGTLLECRLNTTVLEIGGKDVRRIGDIVKHYQGKGWDFLAQHLPDEKKGTPWWQDVRRYTETFSWPLYRTGEMPIVKPLGGTLEFHTGNRRAVTLAIRGTQERIPVILKID